MKNTNSWQRLERAISETGHNINSFAKNLGLRRAENLYQIKRGNNGISLDLAQKIHARYPQYSVAWLMLGSPESAPGNDKSADKVVRIPVYRDRMAPAFPDPDRPDEYLTLSASSANKAEIATPYSDEILNPYLRGALLLLKKHKRPILFGNIYLIELHDIRLFRIVEATDNPETLRLTTLLPAEFLDLEVPITQITALWLVVGAVCKLQKTTVKF